MFTQEIGIDLGTANTVVVAKRRGIVAKEPSVLAINRQTRAVVAVGAQAHQMVGRTPDLILPVWPMQAGLISDMSHSTALLRHMMRKISASRWLRPRVLLTTHSGAGSVDRRALAEAATQAGAGEVSLVEETVAAAIGAGLPVDQPKGSLLIDVGSGTTDVAVIALGGVVVCTSGTAAGDQMDEAIARYLKKEHNMLIGSPTAERIKLEGGAALADLTGTVQVSGRRLTTGGPALITVRSAEIYEALAESLAQIDALVLSVLERTPPELLADIAQSGLMLTGGGALLRGMPDRLARLTGLPVHMAEAPLDAVAIGTARILEGRTGVRTQRVKA